MKTIGIIQPSYLPWLGFFDQVDQSDIFVVYDDVPYDKNGWRNRNKIKTKQGECWLTVPVITKGREGQIITEVEINNTENWVKKHVNTIRQNYGKTVYADFAEKVCAHLESQVWIGLRDIINTLLEIIFEELGVLNRVVYSSQILVTGDKNSRLINIIKWFGGDVFIEGRSGRNYIDLELFKKNGIQVLFQDYKHPVYDQRFGDFIPYLSVLDLICNCGPKSLEIIRSGRNNSS